MNTPTQSFIKAVEETAKDFARWAISYFIAWLIPNGVDFIINFLTKAHIKTGPEIVFILGVVIKYIDYAYHRYNKDLQPGNAGESLGIFRF